jgi:hypothetical protein
MCPLASPLRVLRVSHKRDRRRRACSSWRLTPLVGALVAWQGLESEQEGVYLLGLSLVVIGTALLARLFRLPDRVAFTLAGLWLLPFEFGPEGMSEGIDSFFISGITIVVGAVWVVIYNADVLLAAIVALFGRIKVRRNQLRGPEPALRRL